MSVAIVPMAREFGWTASVAGLVQSAFFWGYALSQIPGGYLTSRIGGRTVLPGGVGLWSGATTMLPLLAGSVPGLCFSRAAVGLGEAMAPSAATDMVSRVIDNSQRARAISFIFAGLHVGSLVGLLIAPVLIEQFGWYVILVKDLFAAVPTNASQAERVLRLWWRRLGLVRGMGAAGGSLCGAGPSDGCQAVWSADRR